MFGISLNLVIVLAPIPYNVPTIKKNINIIGITDDINGDLGKNPPFSSLKKAFLGNVNINIIAMNRMNP